MPITLVTAPRVESAIERLALAVDAPRGTTPNYAVTPGTPCGCFANEA